MRVCLLILVTAAVLPTWAVAQTDVPVEPDLRDARIHHQAGVVALQAGNLPTAEREFRSALSLTFRASTAYNLALILTDQLRPIEALLLFERVLDLADDALPRPRADIEFDQGRAARVRSFIEVALEGADAAEVRLDDVLVGTVRTTIPLSLAVDPGEHRVDAENGGRRVSETLRLEAGETGRVRLAFRPPPSVLIDIPGDSGADETVVRRQRQRRILALVIVGVAVVAGGVVLGIALSNREPTGGIDEPPFSRFDALTSF